jgi:hypothetical protein
VVDTSTRPDTDFFGSPSIAILPDGTYVVGHDILGAKANELHSATVLASRDRGATWTQLAHVRDQFWPLLFVHRGALSMLGTSKEYGDIVIRRSTDPQVIRFDPAHGFFQFPGSQSKFTNFAACPFISASMNAARP